MSRNIQEPIEPFKNERTGTLVEQDPESGEFEIWFPFDRNLVRVVRKGSFVAVQNFDSRDSEKRFSLLELMEAHPTHYALEGTGTSLDTAYPGFVMEAAKSARLDWEQEEPTEHTTVIRCKATRSGKELRFESPSQPDIDQEDALPMIGEDAHLISNPMLTRVINEGLLDTDRSTISPGYLRLDEDIPFHLDVEALLRTHFGVFGFTGAGKSNLLSTIVGDILSEGTDQTVVFSDLMGEYTGLLVDLIHQYDHALIVATEPDSLPGGEATNRYLRGEGDVTPAVDSIIRQLLRPRELSHLQDAYRPVLRDILESGKVQVLSPEGLTVGQLLDEYDSTMSHESAARNFLRQYIEENVLADDESDDVDEDQIGEALQAVQRVLSNGEVPRDPDDWGRQQSITGDQPDQFATDAVEDLSGSEEADIREFNSYLQDIHLSMGEDRAETVTREDLHRLMDTHGPALIVLQSDLSNRLKEETARLIRGKYQYRRRKGQSGPLVSFIFDEADEFIPGSAGGVTQRVRSEIETIARRGRKFGVGVGIATQRATYLDTNIMAQPHTYLISKLPRQADRERVGEAFGLQSEVLDRTLEFNTGEWLAVSYEASGIDGFPIPVNFENANERIRSYLAD